MIRNSSSHTDSTLQLRFKSMVHRHGSSVRLAAGFLMSSIRRRSTAGLGLSFDADDSGDVSLGASTLKSVQTERKAVKVLGTMFLLFFISWASFFSMNLAMGICSACHFDELLYKWFLWLGYSSSILNPIIYTVFNRSFKQTFLRLLTCGLKRSSSRGDAVPGGPGWSDGGGSRYRCSSFNAGPDRIVGRRSAGGTTSRGCDLSFP